MSKAIPTPPKRRKRFELSDIAIADIYKRVRLGHKQHDIASDYGINSGRISEIKTGLKGNHVTGLPQR